MRLSGRIVLVCAIGLSCGGGLPIRASASGTWTHPSGALSVEVRGDPFALVVRGRDGAILLESDHLADLGAETDPRRAYGALSLTHNTDESVGAIGMGWNYYRGEDGPWKNGTMATRVDVTRERMDVSVDTNDPVHPSATISVTPQGERGARLVVIPAAGPKDEPSPVNRVSFAFAMHDDDHFLGFGERFVGVDQRGHAMTTWVEEGGFGQGEGTPPGPNNPVPDGAGETNLPIPWFLSPRGYGLLANTSFRTVFHLGDDVPEAFRVEAWTGALDVTVFADPDPLALVESLTEVTGRPPVIPDWALAPRRRANIGTDEMAKLRAAHVPTSVIDTAMHYFPDGVGAALSAPGAMRAVTDDIHARGFKAIAYFCPFVADSYHPVFDDGAAKGYFVKKDDGTPYTVLDPPYNAAMVDFSNPDAVAWYQGFLKQALDDGWDGWMYDFGEYVPMDARLANGMSGMEAHNLYPVLYQRAASDLLERLRPHDYLFFVRSGYAGTGGAVPMVWAGDQSTDFDLADGLPAALTGALNAGMSGIPLWGSDISGFHFLYNPPPDKEVYLRWTELGAFSVDMHDENEGVGHGQTSDRWQIWRDAETLDTYRRYASLKTRMLPYTKVAVKQARDRGVPVMRHLFLSHPKDPRTLGLGDEYMFGDDLLVAPVVSRGATSRKVYLPEAAYFDFFTHERVSGGDVERPAPLGTIPVFARAGAIVPLLASDVETVVPAPDGSAVSVADRAGIYEVHVFPGGNTSLTLDDGTQFSQTAPDGPFVLGDASTSRGAVAKAASQSELTTCDACAWADATSRTTSFAIAFSPTMSGSERVQAGPLTLTVSNAMAVKRILFVVAQ